MRRPYTVRIIRGYHATATERRVIHALVAEGYKPDLTMGTRRVSGTWTSPKTIKVHGAAYRDGGRMRRPTVTVEIVPRN